MRRGLLKDLANTPTQIACGWRLYEDLERLGAMSGSEIVIDLLDGSASMNGEPLSPPLQIAGETRRWMDERHELDGIPSGLVREATLTLQPRRERRALVPTCSTRITTAQESLASSDTTRSVPGNPG